MNNLMKPNRNRGLDPWRHFFEHDFFGSSLPNLRNNLPAVNLSEDDKSFTVEVVAPGFGKEAFKLRVHEDVLTVSAETANETTTGDGKEYSRREYSSSSFTRSFKLPDNVQDDAINAKYENGILHITIPKAEKETKTTKEIQIS